MKWAAGALFIAIVSCGIYQNEFNALNVLTGLLVLVTAYYAYVTARIAKTNEKVFHAMELQNIEMNRPYISIFPFVKPGDPIIYLRISNTGKTAATNVKMKIDRDFYKFAKKDDTNNLAALNVFKNEICSFPPGMELDFYLGTGPDIFSVNIVPPVNPMFFIVTATYSFFGKVVEEATTVDLRPYLNTVESDPLLHEIKELVKTLEKVKDALKQHQA
mgnify:CR=1 FL=1